jgi:hypothetical protein
VIGISEVSSKITLRLDCAIAPDHGVVGLKDSSNRWGRGTDPDDVPGLTFRNSRVDRTSTQQA